VEDFTAGTISQQPTRRQSSLGEEWDKRIHDLVADWGAPKSPELVEEMIMTALKMARDGMGTADLKLMNRSLKEMRYAAKVFAGYRDFRKVCVFGSARTLPTEAEFQACRGVRARDRVASLHGDHRRRRWHHGRGAARSGTGKKLRPKHPPAVRAARE
jgi:hypothetical protein